MKKLEYKWLVVVVVIFNSFLQYMDMTIVNTALPTIGEFFRSQATGTAWVVTAYLLSFAMSIPLSGWLGDKIGTKKTFIGGLALFIVGSLLCAVAISMEGLVAFRVVQGIGAGILMPVSTTILFRVFKPEERSRVTALIAIPTVIAPTIGPIVGGYLVQYIAWQWIFWINIPLGLLGLAVAIVGLKEQVQKAEGRFDVMGFILGTTGVGALIYALQEVGRDGGNGPLTIVAAVSGGLLLVAFSVVELRTKFPMANLRLFGDRLFSAGTTTIFFVQALFIGGVFILPFFFQLQKGMSPLDSGLITFPTAIGVGMAAPLAARWYHSVGPRKLLIASMIFSLLSFLSFVWVGKDTNEWLIRALLLPRGWAFGIAIVALGAATYARIPPEQMGRASSLYGVTGQIGASAGVAFFSTVLAQNMSSHQAQPGNPLTEMGSWAAFQDTFIVSAVVSIVGVVVAFFVSDRLAAPSMKKRSAA